MNVQLYLQKKNFTNQMVIWLVLILLAEILAFRALQEYQQTLASKWLLLAMTTYAFIIYFISRLLSDGYSLTLIKRLWNILSLTVGFFLGVFMLKADVTPLRLIGTAVTIIGFSVLAFAELDYE